MLKPLIKCEKYFPHTMSIKSTHCIQECSKFTLLELTFRMEGNRKYLLAGEKGASQGNKQWVHIHNTMSSPMVT